jgi:carbonic anhydrase
MNSENTPVNSNQKRGNTVAQDVLASLVVFLVAVPLALGIALASGAPSVLPGLIGCVVGGIAVGLVGGAPLQVSGPAAGLTVIVYGLVQRFGWETTCLIACGAGIMQIILGCLRIARVCLAISPAVVHGMLAGIGLVIALQQIHIVLGGTPESSAWKNLRELPAQIMDMHAPATFLGMFTITILILWSFVPKRFQTLPAALVAVVTTTLASVVLRLDVARVKLPDNLFSVFELPKLPQSDLQGVVIAMLSVAMVASVESLLCAVATDRLHDKARANLDRELIGQGVGNTISGLIGGLPITGVIVRSSANIGAGAQTRLSAILHGIWVLLFALFAGDIIRQIPLATLAGLLVFVGVRLINFHHIKELLHHKEAFVYFATVFGVAFVNLLAGVGIGIALAVFLLLKRLSHTEIDVEHREEKWHVRIGGSLSFISVPELASELGRIPNGASVDIDLMADFMDHAAFEALHNWRVTYEKLGGRVDIDERHEDWYESAKGGKPKVTRPALLWNREKKETSLKSSERG